MATVKDLTIDELRAIIRQVIEETFRDMLDSSDPDAGLHFQPDIEARLRAFLDEKPTQNALGQPAEEVIIELGIALN